MVLVRSGFFLQDTTPAVDGPKHDIIVGFQPKIVFLWCSDAYNNGQFREGSAISIAFIDKGPGILGPLGISNVVGCGLAYGADDGSSANSSEQTVAGALHRAAFLDTRVAGTHWSQAVVECITECGFIYEIITNQQQLPIIINYLAIGGEDLQVFPVAWDMPNAPGMKTVTGVPFQPDLVINTWIRHATSANAKDVNIGGTDGGMSMFTPTDQWSLALKKFNTVASSNYFRMQRTDASFFTFAATTSFSRRGNFSSMNSDGFSVDFVTASDPGTFGAVFSLCIKGGNWKIGSVTPGSDISGAGFTPGLFAMFSALSGAAGNDHLRLGVGGGDSQYQASVTFESQEATSPRNVSSYTKRESAFTVVDNDAQTIDAQATFNGFVSGGVDLNWSGSGSQQIFYLIGEANQEDDLSINELLLSLSQFTVEVAYTGEEQEEPPPPPVEPTVCLSPELALVPACPVIPSASRPIARVRTGFLSVPLCGVLPSASHPAPRTC